MKEIAEKNRPEEKENRLGKNKPRDKRRRKKSGPKKEEKENIFP